MVNFNKEKHEYTNDKGVKLISCTQLLQKYHLSPDYDAVDSETLKYAASKGELIHEEINKYLNKSELGFTGELYEFIKWINDNKDIECFESEIIVYNEHVAGTVDLIYYKADANEEGKVQAFIADIKTTSTVHWDSVSWQLSIYNYLAFAPTYEKTIGKCFHFKEGILTVYDIPLKPKKEVEKLINCYVNNEEFVETNHLPTELTNELTRVELSLVALKRYVDEQEKKAKEIKEKIIAVMEENGVKSVETDNLKITYVAPSYKQTIDTNKLKKELPNVYQDFLRTTQTKASLRITVKENKDE